MTAVSSDESAAKPFKDRSVGLIIFGIVEIIFGCLPILTVFGMSLGAVLLRKSPSDQGTPAVGFDIPGFALAIAVYGVMAWVFISIGVGSILRRRWARAVTLVAAWSWLVTGVPGTILSWHMSPKIVQVFATSLGDELTPSEILQGRLMIVGAMSLFYVLIPLIAVLFYQSRNVKATCEAHDPRQSWTDRCPLPVLAASFWMFVPALFYLVFIFFMPSIPVFGYFVRGWAASVLNLIVAACYALSAYALYRLSLSGWWGAIALTVYAEISGLVTFLRNTNPADYEQMNVAREKSVDMPALFLNERSLFGIGLVITMAFLIYLLFIRRYFSSRQSPA